MKLQLQKELSWSLKGKVYDIVPLEIKRRANKFLVQILDSEPIAQPTNKITTVQDYYEQHIKTPISYSKVS